MSLVTLMEGLAAARIRVVLVGGMAVRVHGVQRVTDDVDVCYDTGFLNERALVSLLRDWNAYPRDVAPGRPFRLSRKDLSRNDTVRLQTVHGYLDLMREVPGAGRFGDIIAHADTLRLERGLVLPVINVDKLIRAKEHAGRAKDVEVLHELRALRALKLARESGLDDLDVAAKPPAPDASPAPRSPRPRGRDGR